MYTNAIFLTILLVPFSKIAVYNESLRLKLINKPTLILVDGHFIAVTATKIFL
jgi:hypothetical protein